LISFGDTEDRVPREMYCICYQMAKHGLSFLLKSNAAFFSPWKESLNQHGETQSASEYDKLLKECAGILCKRYRQIINQEIKGEFSLFQPLSEIG